MALTLRIRQRWQRQQNRCKSDSTNQPLRSAHLRRSPAITKQVRKRERSFSRHIFTFEQLTNCSAEAVDNRSVRTAPNIARIETKPGDAIRRSLEAYHSQRR